MSDPKFRPVFQPILPLVYDDSLSYYEQLGKITYTLNQLINTLVYDGLAYRGELPFFFYGDPEPGYWSVNVTAGSDRGFPANFSGPGTLFILQGTEEGSFQATLIGSALVYTRMYTDETWADWISAEDVALVMRGYTNDFSSIPLHTSGVWAIRNEGETVDLPNNDAGSWTFGTLFVVKNSGYYMATLTTSNGHTYTRFHGGTGAYANAWSEWRSDYGNIISLTEEYISSAATLGTNGYLRYRQMGYEVFLDADIDSVAAPTDEVPIYINVDSSIPHNPNVALQVPFVAGAGHIIGTCRVGITGQLSVERAYDLDTNTKITDGYIRWMHIHACYNIKS